MSRYLQFTAKGNTAECPKQYVEKLRLFENGQIVETAESCGVAQLPTWGINCGYAASRRLSRTAARWQFFNMLLMVRLDADRVFQIPPLRKRHRIREICGLSRQGNDLQLAFRHQGATP